jgi:N6-adenosine-specific RNA methylase IME4
VLSDALRAYAGLNAGAILIDAPIPYETYSVKGQDRSPQKHYQCLTVDELKALPIAAIAAPNCFLFSWIPKRSMFLTVPLMEAWGFRFSGSAFTWVKPWQNSARLRKLFEGRNAAECISDQRLWAISNGHGTRQNSETCWLGRRGKPKRRSYSVRELIIAPRREHSRKPDETYARIEEFCAGPYVEIFARQQWPGWISVGNEIDKFQPNSANKGGNQMDHDELQSQSQPFREGYGARRHSRGMHDNPYAGSADLANIYAARQWIEGWKEADGDKLVRNKIREMTREIAEEMESNP